MKVIFLFPLAFAFFGTIFILINEDFGRVAKGFAVTLTTASIVLLFTPVHFLVPLAMQLVVCIWLALVFSNAEIESVITHAVAFELRFFTRSTS